MLFRLFPYLAITLCIAGCASPKATPPEIPEVARARDEAARIRELENTRRAEFQEKYKPYVCTPSDLPETQESSGPGDQFKSMQFGDHLVLKLKLSKTQYLDGTPGGRMRTESRYQLFWHNKLEAEAESLFSTVPGEGRGSRFYFNPQEQTLAVYDDLAWTTQRCVVFERVGQSWKVHYLQPPERGTPYPYSEKGQILGVGKGKLFLRMDSYEYAFPFQVIEIKSLEFTVG
jgi:hypothetical protein